MFLPLLTLCLSLNECDVYIAVRPMRTPEWHQIRSQASSSLTKMYARLPDAMTKEELSNHVQYPYRVAFSLLNKILDEYTTAVPRTTWGPAADSLRSGSLAKAPPSVDFPPLAGYLVKYQDPKQADTIMKVQQELDETKVELGRTIESILQRGEKLDSLVEKSNQLSYSSKAFYKTVSILGTLLIWPTVAYACTCRRANNRYIY